MHRKFICTILIAVITICLGFPLEAQAFVDVKYHWAEPVVEHLGARNIIQGYPGGNFRPDQSITRAEMCRLITAMLEVSAEAEALVSMPVIFPDVNSNHWARGDINYLYEQGIVTGDNKGLFNPDNLLRRDEAIVILLRALKITANTELDNLKPYKDADQVPDYAAGLIARGLVDGFITGYPDSTLRPETPVTRAELAVLAERGLKYQGNEYQFWGQLLQYDQLNSKVKMTIGAGEERWLSLAPNLRVYNLDGKAVNLYSLGVPYRVYFDLDDEGKIVYIRAYSTDPVNRLRIDQRRVTAQASLPVIPLSVNNPVQLYQSPEQQSNQYVLDRPEASIEVTKADMNLPQLMTDTRASGQDVLIAVIDTGIDPGHPDLQITSSGQRKVVDIIDYTTEGRVDLPHNVSTAAGWNHYGLRTDLSRVRSISGKVKIGYWDEARYDAPSVLRDFNGNGREGDKVLVVAADRNQAGIYDTIYVDSNGNGDIRDEIPLQVFRDSKQYSLFATPDGWGFDYVVSSIAADGAFVQFGFDSHGHGTHVAGIIGAYGQMQGLAPDARLVVIKVAGSDGITNPQALYQAMQKAAEMGAQVVNISMGTPGNPELVSALNELSRKYGTIFSVAAGNSGPGMGTITNPGSADEAIRVGAYVSPEQWKVNYNWHIKQTTLWYFSSLGPRKDGAVGPMLVAPGSVYTTTPLWQKTKYRLDEGTSMAAPHLTGGIAVLMDAIMRKNLVVSPANIRNSLIMSAVSLPDYTLVEQGFGKVDLQAAFEAYKGLSHPYSLVPSVIDNMNDNNRGLYARGFQPGLLPVSINNNGRRSYNLKLTSSINSVQAEQDRLLISGQSQRSIELSYSVPTQPGLYTGFINGDDNETAGVELRIPQVIVVPYDLAANQNGLNLDGVLPAGMVQRYFIKIPAESGRLNMLIRVPQLNRQFMGKVRLHLFDPNGQEVIRTNYAGYDETSQTGVPEIKSWIDKPSPGVWEVVVYSSATLSRYNDDASEYSLELNLENPGKISYVSDQRYLVGYVPATIPGNTMVTLHIRDNIGLKPYTGTLLVNDKLYYARNGRLQIPRPSENTTHIYLTWQ